MRRILRENGLSFVLFGLFFVSFIVLRQRASPESKPVDAAHGETGKA